MVPNPGFQTNKCWSKCHPCSRGISEGGGGIKAAAGFKCLTWQLELVKGSSVSVPRELCDLGTSLSRGTLCFALLPPVRQQLCKGRATAQHAPGPGPSSPISP